MRAAVYRFIDTKNAILGLAFPWEAMAFVATVWPIAVLLKAHPWIQLTLVGFVYGAIRLVNRGRPEGFLQHWTGWRIRQWESGGRLSASARAPTPAFPHGPRLWRDVPRRSAGGSNG
jgi:hypothetical protein